MSCFRWAPKRASDSPDPLAIVRLEKSLLEDLRGSSHGADFVATFEACDSDGQMPTRERFRACNRSAGRPRHGEYPAAMRTAIATPPTMADVMAELCANLVRLGFRSRRSELDDFHGKLVDFHGSGTVTVRARSATSLSSDAISSERLATLATMSLCRLMATRPPAPA